MTRIRAGINEYSVKADEILCDGGWHDGAKLLREVEKLITPGVAYRRAERSRENSSRERNGEAQDRKRRISKAAIISTGKRIISRELVMNRVRSKSWEVDPWPIPTGGWRSGGWKVRDARINRVSLTELGQQLGTRPHTLRPLIEADPPIRAEKHGRSIYINLSDIPEVEARLADYQSRSHERRSVAMKAARAAWKARREAGEGT